MENMDEVRMNRIDEAAKFLIGHPSGSIAANTKTSQLMHRPESGDAKRTVSRHIKRISHMQIEISGRNLLPQCLLSRKALAEDQQYPH
jgi:hypothetical protein